MYARTTYICVHEGMCRYVQACMYEQGRDQCLVSSLTAFYFWIDQWPHTCSCWCVYSSCSCYHQAQIAADSSFFCPLIPVCYKSFRALSTRLGTAAASSFRTKQLRSSQSLHHEDRSFSVPVCLRNHPILWLLGTPPRPKSGRKIENQASFSWPITHTTNVREDMHTRKRHKMT